MNWREITPEQAAEYLNHPDGALGQHVDDLSLNEMGDPCPWPWDPIQLKGASIGQYLCPYCGAMVMAGMDHLDYRPL